MHEMGESSYCSKTSTAGFRSFNDKTMNFDGEIVQITPLPPIPPEIVPLPFVGAEFPGENCDPKCLRSCRRTAVIPAYRCIGKWHCCLRLTETGKYSAVRND